MAAFCIPPDLADKLKKAAIAGEIDIAKMYEMSTADRKAVFEKYADSGTAHEINLGFEKAMISSQKQALANWVNRTFNAEAKKAGRVKDVIEQINQLDEIVNPKTAQPFLEDLVAERLGVRVTDAEAKVILEKSKPLQEAIQKMGKDFGNPTANKDSQLAYSKAREDVDNYVNSLNPQSRLKVASSVISRGNMLFRFGSALVNLASNSVQGTTQAFVRRLVTKSFGGANPDLIGSYIEHNLQLYKESGLDPSRMLSMENEKFIKGEAMVHSQGEGKTRGIARAYEKYIFQYTQGVPDVVYASAAFADRANIESTKVAAQLGLKGAERSAKAREILIDSMRVEPTTKEGMIVRANGVADAAYSTGTQNGAFAKAALQVRDAMNTLTGDLRVGDQVSPFVKTPANFIQIGIEHSGITVIPEAGLRLWKAISDAKVSGSFKESAAESFAGYGTVLARAGVGMVFAYALSKLINPDDFMGDFPTGKAGEQELLKIQNATPNSIRIGNHWISLDYFGTLAPAMAGFLYANKYGKDLPSAAFQYAYHNLAQAARIPGFDQFVQEINALKSAPAGQGIDKFKQDAGNWVVSFLSSRSLPGILYDYAKATDPLERRLSKDDITQGFKQYIPGMRQDLKPDTNAFGETRNTEGWNVLLFGSRVKTAINDPVISELSRLDSTGNLPAITDVSKTSPTFNELKKQVGDAQAEQFLKDYGAQFKSGISDLLEDPDYIESNDEERKNMINKLKQSVFKDNLDQYGYVKPDKQQSFATEPQKVAKGILDAIMPSAFASEGKTTTIEGSPESSLFGSSSSYNDFKTGDTTVTNHAGLIEQAYHAVTDFFTGKKLVNPYVSSGNVSSSTPNSPQSTPKETPNPKVTPPAKVESNGNIDFNSVPRDTNYNPSVANWKPQQPPQDIAAIIKKYFPNDFGNATVVAATENATYNPKVPDNKNTDGSIDRGLFQVNSNSFNGLMQRAGDKLREAGISSFDDMYDPEKNAFVAKVIRDGSKQYNPQTNGWGSWYAWQGKGYNINNGYYSLPDRINYEVKNRK